MVMVKIWSSFEPLIWNCNETVSTSAYLGCDLVELCWVFCSAIWIFCVHMAWKPKYGWAATISCKSCRISKGKVTNILSICNFFLIFDGHAARKHFSLGNVFVSDTKLIFWHLDYLLNTIDLLDEVQHLVCLVEQYRTLFTYNRYAWNNCEHMWNNYWTLELKCSDVYLFIYFF